MFQKAVPVFAAGKERELNTHIVLCGEVASLKDTKILITASSFYQLFVNESFVAFGPCRAAEGYARVDEILLDKYHSENGNTVRIEVAGYACRSYSTVLSDSFVCAEILHNDEVLLCTGEDFECFISPNYLQKVERYSAQRHFSEIYDARVKESFSTEVSTVSAPQWIERKSPYPIYRNAETDSAATVGTFTFDETLAFKEKRYSFVPDEYWGRYSDDEIIHKPHTWIQRQKQTCTGFEKKLPLVIRENEYAIFDLTQIQTGFIKFTADVMEEADVVIGFTEHCSPEKFSFANINCHNVLEYFLPEGENAMMSFEPYTVRYAILLVKKGKACIKSFGVKTFECDMSGMIAREFEDEECRVIYDAAVRSFAHNAADIYTDCPSRERAGWLCDSYFSGIAEEFFLGKNDVEAAFLENYRLYKNDGRLPSGALPMCYPADLKIENLFIPQWDMWYVLEVRDYILRRGHADEKESFKKSVMGVLKFLKTYENEDGMLERLPSWNFVEWSRANDWTNDVNYPTNFLYAGTLMAAYDLYGDESLKQKAHAIIEKTKKMSFNGDVFVDNALRDENGVLHNTGNFSEAGQYYAMLFGEVSFGEDKYRHLEKYVD